MKKSDIVQVEVQLDVAGFSEDIIAALGKIEAAIYNLKDALCAQLRKDNLLSGISTGVDGATLLFNIGEKINWEKFASNIPAIRDYIDAVKFAASETDLFTALFPKLSTAFLSVGDKMKEIGFSIGNIAIKLGNATIEFGKFLAAKVANKAEDIAILALYAVDYIKALGAMIVQLATSTGTWITNTAAKVANTAAQWAQVAATTAWQAICTAATAVTTAFGVAMNFLTSPIGLVVLAIAALIAIIVLLVANWDTVKEALLTAWEAIKNAVAVAVEWISVKLQEGMAFVLNIFNGISEFMQGVFAKDWTEQFGAFGNVLNACRSLRKSRPSLPMTVWMTRNVLCGLKKSCLF